MSCILLTNCNTLKLPTTEIVYVSFSKDVEAAKGAILISTNDFIPCTVKGNKVDLDLGGYYAVHKTDMEAFLKLLEEKYVQENR